MQNDSEGSRGVQSKSGGLRGVENESEGLRGAQNVSEGSRGVQNESEGLRGVETGVKKGSKIKTVDRQKFTIIIYISLTPDLIDKVENNNAVITKIFSLTLS